MTELLAWLDTRGLGLACVLWITIYLWRSNAPEPPNIPDTINLNVNARVTHEDDE